MLGIEFEVQILAGLLTSNITIFAGEIIHHLPLILLESIDETALGQITFTFHSAIYTDLSSRVLQEKALVIC